MAISTVASAPLTSSAETPAPALPPMSRSARLDVLAAAALGIGGVLATIIVALAITLP